MKNYILYILLTFSFAVSAQEKDKSLPKANEEYSEKKFVEAEANYRISHSKFPKRTVAPYNLGNSTYRWKDLYLSGSSIVIGANKIIVNAYSPFNRYAGLSAYDSGSASNYTSSIFICNDTKVQTLSFR